MVSMICGFSVTTQHISNLAKYDQVGKEEVEVGIEFTKEVLKATYQ